MGAKAVLGSLLVGILLVGVGCLGVFIGFEYAAYEQTIADREVTTNGDVVDTDVYQLPDGNWTYEFDYTYQFDQEAEITAQGLGELYPYSMNGSQTYRQDESGGKYDTRSDAASAMHDNFEDDGSVVVYVDPFYPADGSLSDATSMTPRFLQYLGSLLIAGGLFVLAGLARRVSA